MLNIKDKEFIKQVERNQKPLIVCGLIALFLAIFWVYVVNVYFDKTGYISVTQRAYNKTAQIEPKTPLEFKLKETVLSNLEFEISLYQVVKISIISVASLSVLIVSMGCFIFFVINRKILRIVKNIEEKG